MYRKAVPFAVGSLIMVLGLLGESYAQTRDIVPVDHIIVKFRKGDAVQFSEDKSRGGLQEVTEKAANAKQILGALNQDITLERRRPGFNARDTLRVNRHGKLTKFHDWSRVYTVRFAEQVNFRELEAALEAAPEVEWVAPPVNPVSQVVIPNDLDGEGSQWYLDTIDASHAWELTKGVSSVKIGIIDNGVRSHEDIDDKIAGGESTYHLNGHGLAVAGVAAAETNNYVGIAALGWNPTIIRMDYGDTDGADIDIVDAVAAGARIINCSFKLRECNQFGCWSAPNEDVEMAIQDAQADDAIVIAAAGNPGGGSDLDEVPYTAWPAAYDGVIAVSATNISDAFQSGYNYGSFVDVSAPGISILTLLPGDDYDTLSGTSFSAPLTSAVASLIWSLDPSLSSYEVATAITAGAEDKDPGGFDYYYGYGRINAYNSLKEALPDQYDNHNFSSSETLDASSHIAGTTTLAAGAVLTVPSGKLAVIDGTLNAGSSSSRLRVYGKLVIGVDAVINKGNIRVESGGELVVFEGAEFNFDGGDGVYALGEVRVEGTSSNPVRFDRYGGTNFSYIYLGSSADGSELHHVEVDGSTYGIYPSDATDVVLDHVTVTNSTNQGMKVVSDADVEAFASTFGPSTYHGVYVDGSSASFRDGCQFTDTGYDGVRVTQSGYAIFGDAFEESFAQFSDNDLYALIAANGSSVLLGYWDGEEEWVGGFGSAQDFSGGGALYAHTSSQILANKMYWGNGWSDPSDTDFDHDGTSSIDYSSWLTSDPTQGQKGFMAKQSLLAGPVDRLMSENLSPAELTRLFRERARDEASLAWLSPARNHSDAKVARTARLLYGQRLLSVGRTSEGLSYGKTLLGDPEMSDDERAFVARGLFNAYLYEEKSAGEAEEMIALLAKLGDEDATNGLLESLFEQEFEKAPEAPRAVAEESISEGLTVTAYPNPFNPSTTIRYRVPAQANVTLKLYDILGREVVTLVDELQPAGTHEARFEGRSLAGGVYVYRLEVGKEHLSGQVVLVK